MQCLWSIVSLKNLSHELITYLFIFSTSLKLHNENRPLSMKTNVIKKRQRAETLVDPTVKKSRYYDPSSQGSTLGYRNANLPGTGILMMTSSNPPA